MILPWLRGFLSWHEAPLTWTLVAINLFFYLLTSQVPGDVYDLDRRDLVWAGRLYARMQSRDVPADPGELMLLGGQALRDPSFYRQLPAVPPLGDRFGFERWKVRVFEFQAQLENRPVNFFGLRAGVDRPLTWITYQFMHSGLLHIAGNMLMLLLFGAALEQLTGSALLVLVYLVGGLAGAWSFLALSPITSAPMVGASASLSAVMAFYALLEKKKRVRFFYFLSPSPGYWGSIYLPTFLILAFYFVEDLASYLSTDAEIGSGVAYAAHLGGAAFGLALALALKAALRRFPRWEQNLYASYSRSRNEAP